jgi:hypothetical protein
MLATLAILGCSSPPPEPAPKDSIPETGSRSLRTDCVWSTKQARAEIEALLAKGDQLWAEGVRGGAVEVYEAAGEKLRWWPYALPDLEAKVKERLARSKATILMEREPPTETENGPIPWIDARVAAVKNDVSPALVLLSVGSEDRVEKGFHFSVYRGTTFIGKVVVAKVLKDSCGCYVLFTKGGESITAGDSAATRLP